MQHHKSPHRSARSRRATRGLSPHNPIGMLERLEDRALFAASPVPAPLPVAQVDSSTAILDDLYVFGDSLSDTGNLFELSGGAVPAPPYFDGRFSNGYVWVEHLAASLGLDLTDETNFAVGGATSGFDNLADIPGVIEFPGLLDQINAFAGSVGPEGIDPNDLYVVWAGPNDFLQLTEVTPATIEATITTAVGNIVTAVSTLASLGAEHILVPGLPDLGLIPLGAASGFGAELSAASEIYNAALDGALDQLALAGVNTIRMDAAGLQQAIAADPAAFGLSDSITPFLLAEPGADPDEFLFFDDQHPTAAGHELIAAVARDAIYDAGVLPSFTFSAGKSFRYTDADGHTVTLRLRGPGTGEVRLLGERSDAAQIILSDTTLRSSLTIQVSGKKKPGTTVYDLDVNGALALLVAPKVDVLDDFTVDNPVAKKIHRLIQRLGPLFTIDLRR